ncbi:MAG: hypothetical protein ACK5RK_06890 [Betaproteobacteria bacterium]
MTATTSTGQAVSGSVVTLAADPSVSISPGSLTTGANGSAAATVRLLSKANRAVTVTARTGTLSGSSTFVVQGAALSATVATPQPAVNSPVKIDFALRDSADSPMPNEAISIVSSRGSFAAVSAVTDATGSYSLQYTAPSTAGNDVISAQAAGARPLVDPVIQVGAVTVPPPSSIPASFTLQTQPSTVDSNASGSANRAQLSVTVFNAQGLPVTNAPVRFTLVEGESFGQLAATGTVITDGTGVARTDFVPGAAGSAQDVVLICAEVENYNAAPANVIAGCPTGRGGVRLTVRSAPVSVVIAPAGTIIVPDDLSYIYRFVVQVARVGGAAVEGAAISVDPLEHSTYYKGTWSATSGSNRQQTITAVCPNEDVNRNDIIDADPSDAERPTEDKNQNGRLDPRRPVNYYFVGNGRTNAQGQAFVEVIYPKAFGSWLSMEISVRVTVGGSESRATYFFARLPVSAEEVDADGAPAFAISPFGIIGGSTPSAGCRIAG